MNKTTTLASSTYRKLGVTRPAHIVIDLAAIYHPEYGARPYAVPLLTALKEKGYIVVILGVGLTTNEIYKALTRGGMLSFINAYSVDPGSTETQWRLTTSKEASENDPKSWYASPWEGTKKDRELEKYVKHVLAIED